MNMDCVQTQEIRLQHPVRPACPQMAPAEWLHPSPLGAIQPASCPPSAPGGSFHILISRRTPRLVTHRGQHWGTLAAPDDLYLQQTTSLSGKGCSDEKGS